MSGWKIVGISDECTECEVCGRVELKSTVHLVLGDGSELRAGSSCAARKLGTTAAKMRGSVKSFKTRLEIREGEFGDWFRGVHGRYPYQHRALSPAADHFVNRVRARWMERNPV
jgi:ribosome-binding protein aMBF1 (putative translation factor)